MNDIGLEDAEKAAVAILLAAAPEPTTPEPPGDINTLHALFEKQLKLGDQLKELVNALEANKQQEADLLAKLRLIEHEAESVKTKAQALFEALFGKVERPARQIPPVAKPEVSNASPEPVVRGASDTRAFRV
jgi:peptidoglycan hydrolase CwlO-like protein